jgi:hypothetical protein
MSKLDKKISTLLDISFQNNCKKGHDTLIIIVGREGTGKSHLGLHCIDYWLTKLNGECKKEDIDKVSLTVDDFIKSLKNPIRYGAYMLDEAFELSSRSSMSKINKDISQLYMGIRGFNMLTILCIPNLWSLEGYFVKYRSRFVIEITKRGQYRVYNQKQIEKIISYNQNRLLKKIGIIKPFHYSKYPKYNGVLLKDYEIKKLEKMKQMIEELSTGDEKEIKKKELLDRDEQISNDFKILGSKKTAEKYAVSTRAIRYAVTRHSERKRKTEFSNYETGSS